MENIMNWEENGIDSGIYFNHETNESFNISIDWDVHTVNFPDGSQDFDSWREAQDGISAWLHMQFIKEVESGKFAKHGL
jgi:hypothetical protein